ncbi:hypothetical protein C8R48DRAFT_779113 [Suillus tomentosus]|nr:hypothetical protein C8R48DRAFT_779113 [Suillus tomentosus]
MSFQYQEQAEAMAVRKEEVEDPKEKKRQNVGAPPRMEQAEIKRICGAQVARAHGSHRILEIAPSLQYVDVVNGIFPDEVLTQHEGRYRFILTPNADRRSQFFASSNIPYNAHFSDEGSDEEARVGEDDEEGELIQMSRDDMTEFWDWDEMSRPVLQRARTCIPQSLKTSSRDMPLFKLQS